MANVLSGTVKIPGVGPVKKPYVLAGVAVTLAILAVAYWRHRNAPTEAVADGTGEAAFTDPTAGSTLPGGYSGGEQYYPSGGTPFAPYGYDIYGNPLPAPTGATGAGGVYNTNLDWENAAVAALSPGVSESVATLAISRVLGGLTVTEAQKDIFLQAQGLLGQPPQGYPQPIKLAATSSSGPAAPAKPGKPSNPHASKVTRTSVDFRWNRVPGATSYRVQSTGEHGDWQGIGSTSGNDTSFVHSHLQPHSRHRYRVIAVNAAGTGPPSNTVTVTTAK